jgi:hypothetical protein
MAGSIRRREGDWFAVPLVAGGYAAGLVARAPRRGDTLFGYFFGPIQSKLPEQSDVAVYRPEDAIRMARFLDQPLVSGRWPIIAATDVWDRTAWPMPEFYVPDSEVFVGEPLVVAFAEDNPSRFVHQRTISSEETSRYPPDEGVYPAGHLEHLVGEWLGSPRVEDDAASTLFALREAGVRHFLVVPLDALEQTRGQLINLGFDDVDVIYQKDGQQENRVWVTALQRGEDAALQATLDATEARLTEIAKAAGGVYDGPEWTPAVEPKLG